MDLPDKDVRYPGLSTQELLVFPDLSARQTETLVAIAQYKVRHGWSPTIRELMPILQIRTLKGVTSHLDSLEAKGYIVRCINSPRALRFTNKATERIDGEMLTAVMAAIEGERTDLLADLVTDLHAALQDARAELSAAQKGLFVQTTLAELAQNRLCKSEASLSRIKAENARLRLREKTLQAAPVAGSSLRLANA